MAGKPLNLIPNSNLAVVESVSQAVLHRGRENETALELESFDLGRVTAAQVAKAITACPWTDSAAAVAQEIGRQKGAIAEEAVYILTSTDPNICKIGVARDPLTRLAQLQTSHWDTLKIAGLIWVYGSAYPLETRALQFASAMGVRLRGEWVRLSVDGAANLVAESALTSGERLADSEMWLRNRARLLNATIAMQGCQDNSPDWRLGRNSINYGNIADFHDIHTGSRKWSRNDRR